MGDVGSFASVDHTDVYISYLPLAHVFERVAQGLHVYRGAAIGYYQVRERKMTSASSVIMRTHPRHIYMLADDDISKLYIC